jgi:hypothetical protein
VYALGQSSDGRSGSCAGVAPNNSKPEKAFGTHRAAPRALPPSCGCVWFLWPRSGCFFRWRLSEEKNKPETAPKGKIMKLEEIKNKTNEAVSYLVEALEKGQSGVLTKYLNAMARFHQYSFGNIMLIARQRAVT